MLSVALPPLSVALSADTIGDPESTRRVYATVVVFIVLGVAMTALAIWLFRRTRPEPQLLAPLEVMDSRKWRRSEPAQRGRELDEKRPPGARPLRRAAERPLVDSEFDATQPVRSFDDLAPDAGPPAVSSDDAAAVSSRSRVSADPTPTDEDALDLSVFPAVDPNGAAEPDDAEHDATTEQSMLDVADTDPDDDDPEGADATEPDDDQPEGADATEPDDDQPEGADATEPDDATDGTGEGDDDTGEGDDRQPVMPGDGLPRRRRDPSS